MSDFISKAALEARRARYPKCARVELVAMSDTYATLKPGDLGTVDFIDDTGTVFIDWDCGSTLGAVYGTDEIRLLSDPVSDTVKEQILAVRATGKTNMFDANAVQRLANDLGYYELVCFIEDDRKAYATFILTGGRVDVE
jgi:hypothetical protein